jgi:PAS domain S-box-containing protein
LKNADAIQKSSETIFVLATTGQDGPLTTALLNEAGMHAIACSGMPDLVHRLEHEDCGALLIAEEAIFSFSPDLLLKTLGQQPAWSDLPLIVITSGGKATEESTQLFRAFRRNSNVTLLERPFRRLTLTSALEGALRARRRQYEIRDLLRVQEQLFLESSRQLASLKKSQEDLREALSREEARAQELRSIMGSVPAAVWVSHDPKCETVIGNPYASQLLGTPEGDNAAGRAIHPKANGHFRVLKNGVDVPIQERPMERAAATGQPVWSEEMDLLFEDGSATTILINAIPLKDTSGQVTGAIGTALDITERRKMVGELREREAKLQFVLQAGQLGTWELDLSSQKLELSNQAKALFGFAQDAKISTMEQMRSVVHPEDKARVHATVNKAIAERSTYLCEYRVVWPDSSLHWILSRGQVREAAPGKAPIIAGVVADITARKNAEESLARQNARLQLLSDSMAHLLTAREPSEVVKGIFPNVAEHLGLDTYFNFMVDEEGSALRLHTCAGIPAESASRLKRLNFGEAICGTVAQLRKPMVATHIQDTDFEKAALARSFGLRAYACHPLMVGERLIGTLSFASHKRDDFSEDEVQFLHLISGYVSIALDRLHTEAELQNAKATLEAEVEARTAKLRETIEELEGFSYSITHDLRAPLRAMQTFSAILDEESGPQLSATSRDYLRRIMNASQRMDHLIRDVLAYSRVLRTELRLHPLDLPALIEGIVQSYPNLQPEKAEVRIEGEFCTVLGNEAALTQCVSNLLTNAAKFVAPGTFPKIRITAEPKGDRVRVWFEDNGIGIEPQYKDRIFSLFQRLNKEYDGTGLGLSIVRKAVERMGGTVGVESQVGVGSRFWLELQCAQHRR